MLANKLDGPRRGRSFDSINKSYEEKQLNNEVRTTFFLHVGLLKMLSLMFEYGCILVLLYFY